MKVPVLTYHSMKIHGNAYADNDLVALAADLETIHARGFRIVPLAHIVAEWVKSPAAWDGQRIVALTCDDGADFDFADLPHPTAGVQRSVMNILRDFHARRRDASPHVTSFVIVSPEARRELDRSCMIGRGWWNDTWWREAAASGFMDIANHSWDHNHDALPERFSHGVARGTFRSIATQELADAEIRVAQSFLERHVPHRGNTLFAYPYGERSEYLVHEYFPRFGPQLGLAAAFGDGPGYFEADANPWAVPRFVFGRDWKGPDGLERLLEAAARR
ncbi:MAG TPA: polysaccharide deacetylase family protein [Usitatibacter sp.]|jgi:peptidoglycan/xylan/chitin deacetylase (PgdA/CDA1 family)|nr:polysaccharide deacetylase family protein [Usitatibacter sp.]